MTGQKLPCLQPAEQLAYLTAEQRCVVRGVDAGPNTVAMLLATVQRLARVVVDADALGQAALHSGGEVSPEALFAALGPVEDDGREWQWGVARGEGYVAPCANELGARAVYASSADNPDYSQPALSMMRRRVGAWEVAPPPAAAASQ